MRFARTAGVCAVVAAATLVAAGGSSGTHAGRVAHGGALAALHGRVQARFAKHGDAPPTDAFCRANFFDTACYSPQEIQHAYGVDSLLNTGDTGVGQTIVIIDSFAPPTLAADVATFDAGYGLPPLASLSVLSPLGPAPPYDPSNSDMVNWSVETTLDVEWAHAMAPSAAIVVLTSGVSETEGVQGMPEFAQLIKYALDHRLGQVISQSWGATENTLFTPQGNQVFGTFEGLYARAKGQKVTVLASSGDTGSTNYELDGSLYPTRVVGYPASSPWVTSVGGTSLFADTSGNYDHETVWGEPLGPYGYCGATGGGVSQTFSEPSYQRGLPGSVQAALGGHRGIPDVSWLADPCNGIMIYLSFAPLDAGWYFIGGTSESSPQVAGLVADLDQLAGRPIGFLNPYLYALGANGVGFHDVTVGSNADLETSVPGYDATPGWDLATGWGSPDVGQLLRAIAAMPPLG